MKNILHVYSTYKRAKQGFREFIYENKKSLGWKINYSEMTACLPEEVHLFKSMERAESFLGLELDEICCNELEVECSKVMDLLKTRVKSKRSVEVKS